MFRLASRVGPSEGGLSKCGLLTIPRLDFSRDPALLVDKTPQILHLEKQIKSILGATEDGVGLEEELRREFQLHRQHHEDVCAYNEKRNFENDIFSTAVRMFIGFRRFRNTSYPIRGFVLGVVV